jgi:glycyl-tRNA synthetase
MREFEQMEMQYFIAPGKQMDAFEHWKDERMNWHLSIGVRAEKLGWHVHEKLAHYADAAIDITYQFPIGTKEVEGIHSRTNYDLARHEEYSGKRLEYFDPQTKEKYVPYVVETSVGLDRTFLMLVCDAYHEEEVGGEKRTVLRFSPQVAPITVAVFPLVKKDGMPELAHRIEDDLRTHFNTFYDEKGAVGRRYRRMDEAGTPFCVTVDGESLTDGTVTVRDRDTMVQDRVAQDGVASYIIDQMRDWEPRT